MSEGERIDASSGEVQVISNSMALSVARPPAAVLEEARIAAKALMQVIHSKPNPVKMNNEIYLEFEDWQTVARFYGVTAKVVCTTHVVIAGASGFECKAEAIDNRTGIAVSAAEAMCLNDEEKWSARPKYAYLYVCKNGSKSKDDPGKDQIIWEKNEKTGKSYPKKVRELIGTEPVPMFQLRSMAQTRACAKALRNVLAWVVVLAGFKTTPAEEMDGVFPEENKKTTTQDAPSDLPEEPKPQKASPIDGTITDKQITAIDRMIKFRPALDLGWWKKILEKMASETSTISASAAAELITWLGKKIDEPIPDSILSAFEPKEEK